MIDSTYDYSLQCAKLQTLVQGQDILVTQWRGTEAVSRLYRFDVTVAVRVADLAVRAVDLDLETLLDQLATLRLGSTAHWHGIITQASQHGHDDNYDYYQLTLEPRMARLGLRQWSDIYLDQQLDDLIVTLLKEAQLTEKYSSGDTPYDYQITVTDQDLAQMRRPFTCQFEESCLNFLMRKLEFYGVYFWFEQGEDRESIVFGNDASQQPAQKNDAVYYPKGALNPDISQTVLTRMDRHVAMRPASLSLRSLHAYDNTRLDLVSTTNVPAVSEGMGDTQSVEDHFSVVDSNSGGGSNGVPGDTLAKWRAQELSCQTLQIQGEARTPGVLAGRFLAVAQFHIQADAGQHYYVFDVEHEGIQPLETSPGNDDPSYRARFRALPRWRDQESQDDPVQFRPQRLTPVPRVSRLISGFVDMDDEAGPKRYAQPDDKGRYKVRLTFARSNHGAYKNSAWLLQSTPYAAGAPQSELKKAGMHFPLREGTEVLIAFLNEDPDLPVIVGSLPNVEAPSVVGQDNAREHIIRTPGGSGMSIVDGGAGGDGDESQVCLSTPMTNAKLTLGTVAQRPEDEEPRNGFQLSTDADGTIYAGKDLLIEASGKYKLSTAEDHSVHQVFFGAKATEDLGAVSSLTVGASSFAWVGIRASSSFGYCHSTSYAFNTDLNLRPKAYLSTGEERTSKKVISKIMSWRMQSGDNSSTSLTHSVTAYRSYKVDSPDIWLETLGATFNMTSESVKVDCSGGVDVVGATAEVTGTISTEINGSDSKLKLAKGKATMTATAGIDLTAPNGMAKLNGRAIQIG